MGSTQQPENETAQTDSSVATAWGLLSSPRVFLGLSVLLGVLLAWSQTVPQRPAPGELAPLAPFAEAEALGALGLDDVWVAWPVLLVGLLLTLVAAALLMRRARAFGKEDARPTGHFVTALSGISRESLDTLRGRLPQALGKKRLMMHIGPNTVAARSGLGTEALTMLVVGIVALVAATFIGRMNAFDGRISLVPGHLTEASTVAVRDGDMFLPRVLPIDLRCARPDPLDPARATTCTLATGAGEAPETLVLTPGTTTRSASGLTLTPRSETARAFAPDETLELLVVRTPNSPPERLMLQPGQPIALAATGDRLEAYPGPDGPLVLVTHDGRPPELLAPPTTASVRSSTGLSLSVVPGTVQVIEARTVPERLLTIVGLAFIALGLLGLALLPNTSVSLARAASGTRIHIQGAHAPSVLRAARSLGLGDGAAEVPT